MLTFRKYHLLYQYVLFGSAKRMWLLSANGEIQTEAEKKKEHCTGHRWRLESLSSHRFRCCLSCILLQLPVFLKDAYLWLALFPWNTVTQSQQSQYHTKGKCTDEHNLPLDVLLQDVNLSSWNKMGVFSSPACIKLCQDRASTGNT